MKHLLSKVPAINKILMTEEVKQLLEEYPEVFVKDIVKKETENYFKDKLFDTVIPRNIRLAEAPSFGESIIYYDKNSKGATAYLSLAKELIKNRRK